MSYEGRDTFRLRDDPELGLFASARRISKAKPSCSGSAWLGADDEYLLGMFAFRSKHSLAATDAGRTRLSRGNLEVPRASRFVEFFPGIFIRPDGQPVGSSCSRTTTSDWG